MHYRLNHLFRIWRDYISTDPLPQADRWLADTFRGNPKFGKTDRRFYSELFFGALRHALFAVICTDAVDVSVTTQNIKPQIFEELWLKYSSPGDILQKLRDVNTENFFSWVILRMKSEDVMPPDNFKNVFDELEIYFTMSASFESRLLWFSIPVYLKQFVSERQKKSWDRNYAGQFLQYLQTRPPIWLRMNNPQFINSIKRDLNEYNLKLLETRKLDGYTALATEGQKSIYDLPSYKRGEFEIQDLASQQIGFSVKAKPSHFVWDACAGGGGKTIQLASFLRNKGALYASDIREYKFEEIKKRARKAGFHNVRVVKWDGSSLPDFPKEVQNNKGFDWVLADAPCSSSGRWRRNPDAKWRFDPSKLYELTVLQSTLLQNSSVAVKNNGYLVYSTCSFIIDENEKVVNKFLSDNPDFKLMSMKSLGSPHSDSDTMFAAVMRKVLPKV